jgi:hypothetical protein
MPIMRQSKSGRNPPRRPGRPKGEDNPRLRHLHEVMALCVYQLVRWGFDRRKACLEVSIAAKPTMESEFSNWPGKERVEQIYETWRGPQPNWRTGQIGKSPIPPLQPRRYVRASLRARRPDRSLEDLAAELFKRDGRWSDERDTYMPELTETEIRKIYEFAPLPAGARERYAPRKPGRPRKTKPKG